MSRKKLKRNVEKNILVNSRRRCALCYGLNRDSSIKKGQIAHIDKNHSNDDESNLLYLCFEHHDEYDSKNSQSKGISQKELEYYRDELYYAILAEKIFDSGNSVIQEQSSDTVMVKNVIELLGDTDTVNWLQNLVLTAPFSIDKLCYLEGFIHNCEQQPNFCFRDIILEEYKENIYRGIVYFMSIQGLNSQYDSKIGMCQILPKTRDIYEICKELECARSIVINNYFALAKRAKQTNLI